MHHTKGYENEHKDEVYPYCRSCHAKIHIEARNSGRCKIPVNEITRMSVLSANRRQMKDARKIQFNETMIPQVQFLEIITVFKNRISYYSGFSARDKKILYIDI